MCELLGLSSNLPAKVTLSLQKLAEHGGLSGPHKDGWGVAYYEGADVRLFKEAEAAANSEGVRFIAEHELRSHIVIAHVRSATVGEPAYRNTQPFARELAGRMHLFAHNGWLPGIMAAPYFAPARFNPVGETDSERAFCALLDRLGELWRRPGEVPPLAARLAILVGFAQDMRELGPANFLYSDGEVLFAHGDRRKHPVTARIEPPGLVYREQHCGRGDRHVAANALSIEGAEQMVTLVASVPLTDAPWKPLGEGEVIAITAGQLGVHESARLSR